MEYLNLNILPEYCYSSFRYFAANEKHITRLSGENVLLMVFDGVLKFSENGRKTEVKKGEYYIQKKGMFQEGELPSITPKYYYIHFFGDFFPDLQSSKNALALRGNANFKRLMPLFKKLDTLYLSHASAVEASAAFYEILSVLKDGNTNTKYGDVILKTISYLSNNLSKRYSLNDISTACGYSCNQLINIFKAETGLTPLAFINSYRLEAAKQLLISSNKSLKQISFECGFCDYINFYKAFSKAYGCSPLKWKENNC